MAVVSTHYVECSSVPALPEMGADWVACNIHHKHIFLYLDLSFVLFKLMYFYFIFLT